MCSLFIGRPLLALISFFRLRGSPRCSTVCSCPSNKLYPKKVSITCYVTCTTDRFISQLRYVPTYKGALHIVSTMPQTVLPLEHCFLDESAHAAYQRIIPLENSDTKLIRLLGWMLIHAPSETGRADIARSINKCQTNEAIVETGRYYLKHFIKYCRSLFITYLTVWPL
jgi:hypothetical protein